jgi:hypothetical protein
LVALVNEQLPEKVGHVVGLPTSSAIITNPTGVSSSQIAQ